MPCRKVAGCFSPSAKLLLSAKLVMIALLTSGRGAAHALTVALQDDLERAFNYDNIGWDLRNFRYSMLVAALASIIIGYVGEPRDSESACLSLKATL
jgi:hypothetical protein